MNEGKPKGFISLGVPIFPFLHLNLNVVPLEPFDHKLILLAWSEPGANRFPRPTPTDAAIFRLRDADETFFRCGVNRVVVHLVTKFKLPCHRMFTRQGV